MKFISLNKKTRRNLKKSRKAMRKALKHAGGPVGLTTAAMTLGGLATYAAFDPGVRSRARDLSTAARELLRHLASGARHEEGESSALQHAH